MNAVDVAQRRKIAAFDSALSLKASTALPELAVVAALGTVAQHAMASMPAHSMAALRANLLSAAKSPSMQAAIKASLPAAHVAPTAVHIGKIAAITAKAGSLVVPIAAGAVATNLAVGGAFIAHHQLSPARPAPAIVHTTAQPVAPAAQALRQQLADLQSFTHNQPHIDAQSLTQWLQTWTVQTTALIHVVNVRATVQVFLTQVQTQLDELSAVVPNKALQAVRSELSRAVASLPIVGGVVAPTQVPTVSPTSPGIAPTPSTHLTPNPHVTPTQPGIVIPLPTVVPGIPLPTLSLPL